MPIKPDVQPIVLVDAFASSACTGNPAAVCVLEPEGPAAPQYSDAWLQSIALEMNQAETAYVRQTGDGLSLRWFTPATEVDLCGHATLASAHHLWESGLVRQGERIRFHTRSGVLTATQPTPGWIELDFPAEPAQPVEMPEGLAEALGAEVLFAGKNRMDYLVELESEDAVRSLRPDLRAIARLQARGLVVTAQGSRSSTNEENESADCVSRCFYPLCGIDEDPVTGSAHCAVGPYWAQRLGRNALLAYQASPRGGWLRLVVSGDRVKLGGQAITTLRGEVLIPR